MKHAEKLFEVGTIVRAHGVVGEVKIAPDMSDPHAFSTFETVYLGSSPQKARATALDGVRYQQVKQGLTVIARLRGINTRDAADALRKTRVYVPEALLPPLDEGEYFLHDLVDLTVVTESGDTVGHITEVLELPAQMTYRVARDGQPDVLIPDIPDVVKAIDFDAQRMIIHPLDGLLD